MSWCSNRKFLFSSCALLLCKYTNTTLALTLIVMLYDTMPATKQKHFMIAPVSSHLDVHGSTEDNNPHDKEVRTNAEEGNLEAFYPRHVSKQLYTLLFTVLYDGARKPGGGGTRH